MTVLLACACVLLVAVLVSVRFMLAAVRESVATSTVMLAQLGTATAVLSGIKVDMKSLEDRIEKLREIHAKALEENPSAPGQLAGQAQFSRLAFARQEMQMLEAGLIQPRDSE